MALINEVRGQINEVRAEAKRLLRRCDQIEAMLPAPVSPQDNTVQPEKLVSHEPSEVTNG